MTLQSIKYSWLPSPIATPLLFNLGTCRLKMCLSDWNGGVELVSHLKAHVAYHRAHVALIEHKWQAADSLLQQSMQIRKQTVDETEQRSERDAYNRAALREVRRLRLKLADAEAQNFSDAFAASNAFSGVVHLADDEHRDFFTVRAINAVAVFNFAKRDDTKAVTAILKAIHIADDVSNLADGQQWRDTDEALVAFQAFKTALARESHDADAKTTDGFKVLKPLFDLGNKGVVDILQLPNPTGKDLMHVQEEQLERVRFAWRKRLTTRCNLIEFAALGADVKPQHILDALDALCDHVPQLYADMDATWIAQHGGRERLIIAIGAALVWLLRSGCVSEDCVESCKARADKYLSVSVSKPHRSVYAAAQRAFLKRDVQIIDHELQDQASKGLLVLDKRQRTMRHTLFAVQAARSLHSKHVNESVSAFNLQLADVASFPVHRKPAKDDLRFLTVSRLEKLAGLVDRLNSVQ